jgi:hypothetical protein
MTGLFQKQQQPFLLVLHAKKRKLKKYRKARKTAKFSKGSLIA